MICHQICLLKRLAVCLAGVLVIVSGSAGAFSAPLPVSGLACLLQDGDGEKTTGFDQELALETFDYAWKLVRDSYFRKDMNGVDWDAVRAELRPKVARVTSNSQLRMILQDMVGRLHQSHFEVIPGDRGKRKKVGGVKGNGEVKSKSGDEGEGVKGKAEAARVGAKGEGATSAGGIVGGESGKRETGNHGDGGGDDAHGAVGGEKGSERGERVSVHNDNVKSPASEKGEVGSSNGSAIGGFGIDVRVIGEEVVVTRVCAGSSAAKAGVKVGWVMIFVGANSMQITLTHIKKEGYGGMLGLYGWQAVTRIMSGKVGTRVKVWFIDGDGKKHALYLTREKEPGQMVKFGNLPALHVTATSREEDFEGVEVGIIRFSMWMFPVIQPIGRAMEKFADAGGIILDLRGNVGGIGGMVMGIGGYFFDKPISLGTMFQRGQQLKFNVNPRGVSISGKRRNTYREPVAILIDGESASTTEMFAAGMQATGRARIFGEVSAGMALPAVATELPNGDILLHAIADFEDPNGVSIEGRGVIPDEKIVLSRARLLAGHDDTMDAALRWIAQNRDWKWEGNKKN